MCLDMACLYAPIIMDRARVFPTPDADEEQRMLMVEIGRFPVTLPPGFTTEISRKSKDSSVIMKISDGLTLFTWNYLDGRGHFSAKKRALYGTKWVQKLYSMKI